MKKIQVVFAIAAFLMASVGVFATQVLDPIFYESMLPNDTSCSVEFTGQTVCDPGDQAQCQAENADEDLVYISVKATSSSPCLIYERP